MKNYLFKTSVSFSFSFVVDQCEYAASAVIFDVKDNHVDCLINLSGAIDFYITKRPGSAIWRMSLINAEWEIAPAFISAIGKEVDKRLYKL